MPDRPDAALLEDLALEPMNLRTIGRQGRIRAVHVGGQHRQVAFLGAGQYGEQPRGIRHRALTHSVGRCADSSQRHTECAG